jgi:hypothetical protein
VIGSKVDLHIHVAQVGRSRHWRNGRRSRSWRRWWRDHGEPGLGFCADGVVIVVVVMELVPPRSPASWESRDGRWHR